MNAFSSNPTICDKCKRKPCLKTKRPCTKVEEILRREKIYSANWIRPMMPSHKRQDGFGKWREISFSSLGNGENSPKNQFL